MHLIWEPKINTCSTLNLYNQLSQSFNDNIDIFNLLLAHWKESHQEVVLYYKQHNLRAGRDIVHYLAKHCYQWEPHDNLVGSPARGKYHTDQIHIIWISKDKGIPIMSEQNGRFENDTESML